MKQPCLILHLLKRALLIIILSYLGSILLIVLRESAYLYYPEPASEYWDDPDQALPWKDVFLDISPSVKVHGWLINAGAEKAMIFLHGNAGNLSSRLHFLRFLSTRLSVSCSILIMDYPGYGKSNGKPTEKHCYATADAAYRYLVDREHYSPDQILFFGRSLGAAVALHGAVKHTCAGLIMESGFISVSEMAKDVFPFLPGLNLLARQRFDNGHNIKLLQVPLLIMHGGSDDIIPVRHSRKLKTMAPGKVFYHEFPKAGHDGIQYAYPAEYVSVWNHFLKICFPPEQFNKSRQLPLD